MADKRPETMTGQAEHLAIQMRTAKQSRLSDMITAAVFAALLAFFALAILVTPDDAFSEQENRVLQRRPQLTLGRLIEGKFTAEITGYYADQFFARDHFVGLKGMVEIALMKRENNGVVLAKDGYLIQRGDYPDVTMLDENIASINRFAGALTIPFTLAVAGRPVDALGNYLPAGFPQELSDALWERLPDCVDLLKPLQNREGMYYKTDHHWTTLGAYYAYAEIMRSFGQEPQPLASFTAQTASDAFFGTTWSSAGMKWVKPDTLDFFRYDGDREYTTTIRDTGENFEGFYQWENLEKRDQYSAFIGGNHARIDVMKNDSGTRPKLLLIKDSFAHSVVPFLAYHYDLVIIDLRYFSDSPIRLAEREGVDRVLILNYIQSLVENSGFALLNYGLLRS